MTVDLIVFGDGTKLVATTDSAASHYGIPAVVHEGCDQCKDAFGPADPVPGCLEGEQAVEFFGKTPTMAHFVERAASKMMVFGDDLLPTEDSKQRIAFVQSWLSQWPDGPQGPVTSPAKTL